MLSLNALKYFLFKQYHFHFGALTENEDVILFRWESATLSYVPILCIGT